MCVKIANRIICDWGVHAHGWVRIVIGIEFPYIILAVWPYKYTLSTLSVRLARIGFHYNFISSIHNVRTPRPKWAPLVDNVARVSLPSNNECEAVNHLGNVTERALHQPDEAQRTITAQSTTDGVVTCRMFAHILIRQLMVGSPAIHEFMFYRIQCSHSPRFAWPAGNTHHRPRRVWYVKCVLLCDERLHVPWALWLTSTRKSTHMYTI